MTSTLGRYQHRHSDVPGVAPAALMPYELAVNPPDKKLFLGNAAGVVIDMTAAIAAATVALLPAGNNLFPISATYAVAGAIAPTNTLAYLSSAVAISMTLAAGADTHGLVIVNGGVGSATIALSLGGSAQSVVLSQGSVLNVSYQPSLGTYLRIS